MTTLSHKDWLRLHEIVLDLHTATNPDALAASLLAALNRLFPFDIGNVQDDRGGTHRIPWRRGDKILWQAAPLSAGEEPPRGRRIMPPWGPNFLPLREAFFAVSAERHPQTDYFRRTGDGAAHRITEIVPLCTLRQTAFFNEISRPLGVVHQLTIYAPLPSAGTLTVAAARSGRVDFSERDRLMLELLRPHVAAAWLRALRLEEQEKRLRWLAAPAMTLEEAATQSRALCRLGLTPREAEVLLWLSQGKTNPEIAIILVLSPATVKSHVEHILAKLCCETRTAAARTALESLG